MDQDDRQLLREFVTRRCEAAFAGMVRRHVDLVYSAARRQVRDPATAEDVTQEVFVTLALKAHSIRDGEALAGWLLVTTRFVALNLLRSNERRRRHEHEAAAMASEIRSQADDENDPPLWRTIGPLLDDAIARLKREDRDAVVMRYFQGRSVAEVASALGISQEAAQKRITRAVGRLRSCFAARGITASDDSLASILSANAVAAAPAALAAKIAAAALAKASIAGGGASLVFGKGTATTIMATANTKLIVTGIAGVLLAGVGGTIAYQELSTSGSRQVTLAPPPAAAASQPQANPSAARLSLAPQTTTGPIVNWMQQLHEVYDLADGETVKFVPRPFISDRLLYYQSYMAAQQVKSNPNGPDVLVFDYESHVLRWRGAMYADGNGGDIGYAIATVAGIERSELAIPAEILRLPMKGDWVYRVGSTPQQRMDVLAVLVRKQLQQRHGAFVQQPMERDAIIVSGSYDYHPLPQADLPRDPNAPRPVYVFRGDYHLETVRGGGTGDLEALCRYLASNCDCPVSIETKLPGDVLVKRQNALYYTIRPGSIGMADADVDSVIANVAKQTSLQFKRAKRTLPTWIWQKDG